MNNDLLKFRAWNKEEGKMYYMSPIVGSYFFTPEFSDGFLITKDMGEVFMDDNFEKSQHTGFKDNKGNDIYFGDVVKFKFFDKNDPSSLQEDFALITTCLSNGVALLYDGHVEQYWEDDELWIVEVIGNSYQNPELLEKYNIC